MMTYAIIETIHQIKYLRPFAMNILLFILHSLSFYFMSLTTSLAYLISNEHFFRKEKKEQKTYVIEISIR